MSSHSHSSTSSFVVKFFLLITFIASIGATLSAQDDKQLETAMKFKPKHHTEVDYEKPGLAVLKDCKFIRTKSPAGFVVHHVSGRVLRRFIDTDGDGDLDQWSYYNDGLEVYRDVDGNKDGKLDQYRWLGTAGTRWGIDKDQNGEIDSWKVISPEEIAYECFQAIKKGDQARFNRLLLSESEYAALGLNSKIGSEIQERWKAAKTGFAGLVRTQKVITPKSEWVYAGNGQPAMMASGDGNKQDLIVYDHASGFFKSGNETRQLALGSIVRVGESWRMVELPEIVDPNAPLKNGGAFFPIAEFGNVAASTTRVDKELAKLFTQLPKIEEKIETAKGVALEKLQKEKADLLVQIYIRTKEPKSKLDWIQNLADSVSSAYQADKFGEGITYLNSFIRNNRDAKGIDYVKWRAIFATYGWAGRFGGDKQKDVARENLISELKSFQKTYPKSNFSADALVQLAVHSEISATDEPDEAIDWYKQCVSRFPNTDFGKRARGAIVRLSSFGKTFPFKSKTAAGRDFDLESLKGKIVVLHYWETWCLQEDEVDEIAKLAKKYKDDVVIIGCNIEGGQNATAGFKQFVKSNGSKMTWPQLHEPGGVDSSPLAHQLGVAIEPLIVLVDKKGQLVETNIAVGDLEREIERERRRR